MIFIIRALFLALVSSVAIAYTMSTANDALVGPPNPTTYILMVTCVVGAFALFVYDIVVKRKNLHLLSGLFFGLLVGLVVSLALGFLIDQLANVFLGNELLEPTSNSAYVQKPIGSGGVVSSVPATRGKNDGLVNAPPINRPKASVEDMYVPSPWRRLIDGVKLLMGLMTTYITTSFILQTKDDFRFIIPYVEFSRGTKGLRPLFVDTSILIDGRIAELAGSGIFDARLYVPKFVINELHTIADSADRLKRARGRRGLDILQKLQANAKLDLHLWDGTLMKQPEGEGVDQKLVALAQQENGRIVTNDFNLLKVAQVRGVEVVNLNTIADALRTVHLPGEVMHIRINKPGEGPTQGVGYLEDGTMVVVDGARDKVGQEVDITVTNALQTNAGKMIFGRVEGHEGAAGNNPKA